MFFIKFMSVVFFAAAAIFGLSAAVTVFSVIQSDSEMRGLGYWMAGFSALFAALCAWCGVLMQRKLQAAEVEPVAAVPKKRKKHR